MSDLALLIDHGDGVSELRLNRPDVRNALNMELIEAARAALTTTSTRGDVRSIILGGEGRSFCAGMDLKAVRHEPAKMGELLLELSRLMREIRRTPQPVVARVQGAAIGGGCGLMSVCDFALTHPEAKIGYPEVDLGICPAVVAPWLVRRVGAGKAREVLLAGGTMSGREAHEIGLAGRLVEHDQLDRAALELAQRLARGGLHAMAATKNWLNELDGSFDDDLLDRSAQLSAEIVAGDEARQRLAAMFDRPGATGRPGRTS